MYKIFITQKQTNKALTRPKIKTDKNLKYKISIHQSSVLIMPVIF